MNRGVLCYLAVAALAASCATPPPVQSGRKGFFQRIEEADRGRSPAAAQGTDESADEDSAADAAPAVVRPKKLQLRWPLKQVRVTSGFGKRGKEFHEGVDLHAAVGTPVFAAEAGTVIYAGRRIRGYGNMLVIRHAEGFSTVYAHNSRLLVRHGQAVKRGQQIAVSGKSGHVRGPHLHFEVRSGVAAVDPLTVLPVREVASARVRP